MLSGNVMIIHLIVEQKKKDSIKMSQHFPRPSEYYSGNVKAELNLSNSLTKTDLQ